MILGSFAFLRTTCITGMPLFRRASTQSAADKPAPTTRQGSIDSGESSSFKYLSIRSILW